MVMQKKSLVHRGNSKCKDTGAAVRSSKEASVPGAQ